MKYQFLQVGILIITITFCDSAFSQNETIRQDALSPSIILQWYEDSSYCMNISGKSDSCLNRPQYSFCFVDDEFESLNVNYGDGDFSLIRFDRKKMKYYYTDGENNADSGYVQGKINPADGHILLFGTGCKKRQFNIDCSESKVPISIREYEVFHNRLSQDTQGIDFNFIDGYAKFLRYSYNGNCWLMVHFKKRGRIKQIAVKTPTEDGYNLYSIKRHRLVPIRR